MSRIATLAAVLTMVVAPAAIAAPADLRAPDQQVSSQPKPIDLRSPDAVHGFVAPSAAAHSSADNGNDVSTWAILAIIAGAVGACALLAVMLRRHLDVGRPASV
jgi:hypothetical protein